MAQGGRFQSELKVIIFRLLIFALILISGFILPVVINTFIDYSFDRFELPILFQYLFFPLLHTLFINFAYSKITGKTLVHTYKILTLILIYLTLIVAYVYLDIFTALPYYIPLIIRYRG